MVEQKKKVKCEPRDFEVQEPEQKVTRSNTEHKFYARVAKSCEFHMAPKVKRLVYGDTTANNTNQQHCVKVSTMEHKPKLAVLLLCRKMVK